MIDIDQRDTVRVATTSSTNRSATNAAEHWIVYRTRFLVRARQLSECLSFTDVLGREQHGEPGDYLVESSDGLRRIAPRAIFEDVYVPLTRSEIQPPQPYKVPARVTASRLDRGMQRSVTRHAHEDRFSAPAGGRLTSRKL